MKPAIAAALSLCVVVASGCPTATATALDEVKTSFFELELDGQTLRLDESAEHAGQHVFRASGPFEETGRVQLWLSLAAPAARIIPYGSDGAERLQRRWQVSFARGARVYTSPEHGFIGEVLPGDAGTLRVTKDGLVIEGTFSTPVTSVGDGEPETIQLTDVRFRFYKTRYLDPIGTSDLRGGAFVGPVEGIGNVFGGGLTLTEKTDPVATAIRALTPEDLHGVWQTYRRDQQDPSSGQNSVQDLPPPGFLTTFGADSFTEVAPPNPPRALGAVTIRSTEGNVFLQVSANSTDEERLIFYWEPPDHFVITDGVFLSYLQRIE